MKTTVHLIINFDRDLAVSPAPIPLSQRLLVRNGGPVLEPADMKSYEVFAAVRT